MGMEHKNMAAKDLFILSHNYIKFMSDVGNLQNTKVYEEHMMEIFAEDVCKIENGATILKNIDHLKDQLHCARSFAFPWTIEILDCLIDEEKNASAIRFSWNSKKVGLHITTAILKFNSKGKVVEINEVYNKFAEITH